MTKSEIMKVLNEHKAGLNVDLSHANLRYADLYDADLSDADLSNADLYYANLHDADLRFADLSYADLSHANLRHADLSHANLRDADLSNANLSHANLRYADLYNANLRDADLRHADLSDADLSNANLASACLCDACLSGLRYNENTALLAMACPQKGAFIGYKKANGYIVELLILEDARRSSATTRKCRCDKARVLSITNLDGQDVGVDHVCSSRTNTFIYRIGSVVEEPEFCTDRWKECAPGIHFFITREEAVNYE
ncbi:pentapeptide repeat-containing protein [Hominenteromicrobium sp.]|uniref:pentapeptide repeat-containing protein n=1 Tax=Hominenteromicrobium sp. TaxID=3073581 RepID=UPI003A92BBA4